MYGTLLVNTESDLNKLQKEPIASHKNLSKSGVKVINAFGKRKHINEKANRKRRDKKITDK